MDDERRKRLLLASALLVLDDEELDTTEPTVKRRRYTKRIAGPCEESPYGRFLSLGDDPTYRYLFRVPRVYFHMLLETFEPIWKKIKLKPENGVYVSLSTADRDRQASSAMALALVLRFLTSTTEGTDCAFSFGMIPPTYCRYLNHGLHCLRLVFDRHFPQAHFDVPNYESLRYYSRVIEIESDGKLSRICGFVDGIVLHFERSANDEKESCHFSGFKRMPGKKLVCLFAPDGSIMGAAWAPGCEHDATLWNIIGTKFASEQADSSQKIRVLGDSAFQKTVIMLPAVEANAGDVDLHILRRFRNCAEIGLGQIMRATRRLYVKLPADNDTKVDTIIELSLLYQNFRARIARVGQLREMFGASLADVDEEFGVY